MSIEDSIQARIRQLITESSILAVGDENDHCVGSTKMVACSAWLTTAQNAVHLAVPNVAAPYRMKADRIARADVDYVVHNAVEELAAVLKALLVDAEAGLLVSVADQARAETFDDFLDHANNYLDRSCKNEAGVIAGVVFEDSLRKICRKLTIVDKDQQLDALISELASRNEFTAVQAKRARVCAHVRTKATHAQWAEFDSSDVRATIAFTRELIESKLA